MNYISKLIQQAFESTQKNEGKVNMSKLKNEIQAAVNEYFKDDKDLLEYVYIDTKKDKFGRDVLEVRAELGYNSMVKLADYLNKIVTKYDKYAYFEQETSGIMVAVFESAQKNEDDGDFPETYKDHTILFNWRDKECYIQNKAGDEVEVVAKSSNATRENLVKAAKAIIDRGNIDFSKKFVYESAQKNEALNLDKLTDADAEQLIMYLNDFIKDKASKYYYIDKIEAILKKSYNAESAQKNEVENNADTASAILNKLKEFKHQFKHEILEPAKDLLMTGDTDFIQGGDKANPHIRAIYRVEDAIINLENQLRMQMADPLPPADMDDPMHPTDEDINFDVDMDADLGADAGLVGMDQGSLETFERSKVLKDTDESYSNAVALQQLEWSAQDSGYSDVKLIHGEAEGISVYLAHDEEGNYAVDVSCTEDKQGCGFAESNEWAEIVGFLNKKGIAIDDDKIKELLDVSMLEDTSLVQSDLEDPQILSTQTFEEVQMIGDWEYNPNDTQYEGAATLLYDSELSSVLIMKNSGEVEGDSYLVYGTADFGAPALEYSTDSIKDVVAWLDLNKLPVPTQEALNKLEGITEESIEALEESMHEAKDNKKDSDEVKKPKLPKDLKCVEDDPTISTLAEEVDQAEVTDIKEPSQK